MCGIIGYLGKHCGGKFALEGIKMLRNRGYDSVGCCSYDVENEKFAVTKYANQPEKDSYELFEESFSIHKKSNMMTLHTRWATTGIVSDANSHPHLDTIEPNLISVVHNGIISNYSKLKDFLVSKDVKFNSETDSEVICNLISYYYHQNYVMMDAIKLTLQELEGTWALIIMNKNEPNSMYVCKKGSPILLGYSDEMCIVSSESSGFSNYLRNYHIVEEKQIIKVVFNEEDKKINFFQDDKLTELSTHTLIHQTLNSTSPEPYPYWTLKEIMEQSESVQRAINHGGRISGKSRVNLGGLKDHSSLLLEIKNLTIIATGTSMYASILGMKYLQNIGGFDTIRVIDASEFLLADICQKNAGILVLSQSGETRDIVRCIELIRENRPDVLIFSVVNVVESLIAREADCGIYLNAGREVGVASTKSFTNQVIIMILISIWFAQNRKNNLNVRTKIINSLHKLSNLITRTLNSNDFDKICNNVSDYIMNHQHLFILGREKGLPIALEAALKIKELSYIHAEAYPGGSLKHGPLALITDNVPIIVLRIGDSDIITKMDIAAEETKSRGAYLISISSSKCNDSNIYDQEIIIPKDQFMEPLLSILPFQYIAYLLATKKGFNPDYPRNLAKTVTTD